MPNLHHNELLRLIRVAQEIEIEAYRDLFNAAPEAYRKDHGLLTAQIDGVQCFAYKTLPVSLLNRAIGVGTSIPATQDLVKKVLEWMRENANATFNVGVDINSMPDALGAWLTAADLAPKGGGIARFVHSGTGAIAIATRLSVGRAEVEEGAIAGKLIRTAFGFPEHCDEWFGQIAGRKNWHLYFAYDQKVPVGIGAIYIKDEVAWLGIGGTLKEFRNQGAQNLLLSYRIKEALRLGAKSIHIETGSPAPGDSVGPSYRNILRAGFDLLFARTEYMP